MAWVNFSLLLGGGALMAVPVVLHLIMRQQPKRLIFPAFRFLQLRHRGHKLKAGTPIDLRQRQWTGKTPSL